MCHILDSTYTWYHMVFVCLFGLTWYDNLRVHPSWRISFLLTDRVVFHCISVPWWCRLPTFASYTVARAAPWSQQSRGWDLITYKAHLLHTQCLHPLCDMYCVLSNTYLLFFLTVSDIFFKKPGKGACVPPNPWLLPSSEHCDSFALGLTKTFSQALSCHRG